MGFLKFLIAFVTDPVKWKEAKKNIRSRQLSREEMQARQ